MRSLSLTKREKRGQPEAVLGWMWALTLLLGQCDFPLPDYRPLQSRAGTQNPKCREFRSRTVCLCLFLSLEHRIPLPSDKESLSIVLVQVPKGLNSPDAPLILPSLPQAVKKGLGHTLWVLDL